MSHRSVAICSLHCAWQLLRPPSISQRAEINRQAEQSGSHAGPTGGTAPPRGNYPTPLQALIPPPLNKTPFHIQNPEDGVVLISLGVDCYCSSSQKCPFWHGSAPIQPVWFNSKPQAYCTSSFFLNLFLPCCASCCHFKAFNVTDLGNPRNVNFRQVYRICGSDS